MNRAQQLVAERLHRAGARAEVVDLVATLPQAGRGGVDSDAVNERAQLRACITVLAELARRRPSPPATPPRRRWFRREPRPALLVAPVDDLMGALWQQRVQAGGALRWHRLWDVALAHGSLPSLRIEGPWRPDPVGTDLLRRLHLVLATAPASVRCGGRALVTHRDGVALGVPPGHLAWATEQAQRAGLDVPSIDPHRPRRVSVAQTLARAIEELTWPSV